jgi:hypothetical protein
MENIIFKTSLAVLASVAFTGCEVEGLETDNGENIHQVETTNNGIEATTDETPTSTDTTTQTMETNPTSEDNNPDENEPKGNHNPHGAPIHVHDTPTVQDGTNEKDPETTMDDTGIVETKNKLEKVDVYVASSSDDAEEASSGKVNLTSSDLELVQEKSKQVVGIRFANISIPQGATITKAYIQFAVDEVNSERTNLKIYIQNSANAQTFNSRYNNITSRDKINNSVNWMVQPWDNFGDRDSTQKTPNLKNLVQQIVNMENWYSDNAIAFIIDGDGKRVAISYDNDKKLAPMLHIEYIANSNTTSMDTPTDMTDNGDTTDTNDNTPTNMTDNGDTTDTMDTDSNVDNDKYVKVSKYHRVVWDKDPAHRAIVAFTPNSSNVNYIIKYGQTPDEMKWKKQAVNDSKSFDRYLTTYFARLKDLKGNSEVYYRICNDDGCGDRYWFRTSPTDNRDIVVVAGGDTRSGWQNRQDGNKLIAKIRPLFVMHGGDFTNKNSYSQMEYFLKDWTLSYSKDNINGIEYKRVYPIVPAHGNHEDRDLETLCEVFGLDTNGDGECSADDSYGAFTVSPLLRVYTLNSQFQYSGRSSLADRMNNWFDNDIVTKGQNVKWRIAQYHKPMFPHYTGKPDNPTLFNWWANKFYENGMNLVVESDTHIVKTTKIVKPASGKTDYEVATNGGTLYVGEGSWGAEARSANDRHSWTQDMGAFQQYKVIVVSKDKMDVRTAEFNGNVKALSKAQRDSNSALLPKGINWWNTKGIGEVITLKQNANKQSIMGN